MTIFNSRYLANDYAGATKFAKKKMPCRKNPSGEDLLWSLQLGSLERIQNDYAGSTASFDRAENMLGYFAEKSAAADTVLSIAASDNVVPYKGQEYDGVMLNTYKALNFMVQGNYELARVEFNRALDRQRRSKEKFSAEISKLNSEIEKEKSKDNLAKSNIENPKIQELITKSYPNISNFEAYPDFVNPFATYMAGVFFNLVNDNSKAVDLLKESYGMVPGNQYLAQDLYETEKVLDKTGRIKDTVWLIYENGLGPIKEEFRIDIPLFVVTQEIRYIGIALPQLKYRSAAYDYLIADANGQRYKTEVVSDMDKVVQAEFNKDFGAILTRAIISATAKVAAQYAMENNHNSNTTTVNILSIAVSVYSAVSTAADVRIWTTLPKNFQVARFPMPADGKLRILGDDAILYDVNIPSCNNAIVYVKIPARNARALCDIITY